jgi:hypothetical protein
MVIDGNVCRGSGADRFRPSDNSFRRHIIRVNEIESGKRYKVTLDLNRVFPILTVLSIEKEWKTDHDYHFDGFGVYPPPFGLHAS